MATKPKIEGTKRGDRYVATSPGAGERTTLRGYINFKPSDDQKIEFNKWYVDDINYRAAIVRILDSGWKLTIASDKSPGVFVATTSIWVSGHPSAGIILNTRGVDCIRTMAAVAWALEELYDYSLSEHLKNDISQGNLF